MKALTYLFSAIMLTTPFELTLFEQLDTFFAEYDFVLLPERRQFRRPTATGFQNVIVSVSPQPQEHWVEINFGLRHAAIEQQAQQFLDVPAEFRPDANTLVISIGQFNHLRYFQYKIQNQDDLRDAAEQIRQFFEHQGFTFLNQASTLAFLEKTFNAYPAEPCRFVYNQVHRCFKGIVAARLAGNPRFADLVNRYRSLLPVYGATEADEAAFSRLADFLQTQHFN